VTAVVAEALIFTASAAVRFVSNTSRQTAGHSTHTLTFEAPLSVTDSTYIDIQIKNNQNPINLRDLILYSVDEAIVDFQPT
jgi:hypothetical protein